MKYFKDENDQVWAFEDDVPEDVIDSAATDFGLTFASITEQEFQDTTAPGLSDSKVNKIQEIEDAFAIVEAQPVAALGEDWIGGYMSGMKYKAAYDLAELASQTEVGFKDVHGTKHTLSFVDAQTVLLAIGADYLTKDAVRDGFVAQVNAAVSQAELDAIIVSFE